MCVCSVFHPCLQHHDLTIFRVTSCLHPPPLVVAAVLCGQEVEELRQKLQEVEIGTALSQADSNFLQRELEEKEADIGG